MKVKQITGDMRRRIIEGEFPPGTILPNRKVLLEHYSVSVAAFQKTINTLISEGFLFSRNSSGVFVRKDPPHLFRLGLAIPVSSPAELQLDSLWNKLILAGNDFHFEGQKVELKCYYIGNALGVGKDLFALQEDVANHQLCGVVFLRHSPAVDLPPDFPQVNFDYRPLVTPPAHIRISTDHKAFFALALEKMKQCGAKNVAVILQASLNNQSLVQLKKLADNSGLFIPPDWLLALNFELKDSIAQKWLISGLFSGNRKVHPDGLIVMNENFVPSVIDQLYQEGRIPGQNIHVVAHCNWPISSNEHPGVHYIGFHTGDILKSFMSGIRKFTGDTTPVVELLPRMFKSGEAPLR
jgi:hypothetical protein